MSGSREIDGVLRTVFVLLDLFLDISIENSGVSCKFPPKNIGRSPKLISLYLPKLLRNSNKIRKSSGKKPSQKTSTLEPCVNFRQSSSQLQPVESHSIITPTAQRIIFMSRTLSVILK